MHDHSEYRERFGYGPGFGPIFDVTNGENARHLARRGGIQFGHFRDGVFHARIPGDSDAPLTVNALPSYMFEDHLNPSRPDVMTVGWFRGILERFADDDVLEIEADGDRIQRIAVRGVRKGEQR